MGFLSWLFKEEEPPEPLVFGALLQCPHGSKKNYLFVETDNLDINHLPQAYVDDCKAYKNIMPFGECLSGSLCEYKMELEKQWENPEPQTMLVNGKEIITTKSVLLCKAEGVEIKAIKSGQDRVFAEQVLLYAEMDARYPGLREILDDPYGSLYLKEGMYEKAIQFLEDRLKPNGGELFLPTIYDKDNPEGDIIRGILARLLPDCDASAFDRLINGLETAGYQNGMDEDAGYDVHTLNAEMIEMLRRDCKKTAEKIETDENARWMEEHKKFMTIFADSVTEFAYGVAIYHSATAKGRSQGRDEVEETGEESNGEVEKTVEQEKGENAKIEGEGSTDFDSQNPMFGEDWHRYFNETYGQENVMWESASMQDIIDMPSKIIDFSPQQIANLAQDNGWSIGTLGQGSLSGVPYEQGGGLSFHAPNGGSEYIQYHPGGGHHGELPYFKISSGPNGIVRYFIGGNG